MYAQVGFLAILSTYLLVRWTRPVIGGLTTLWLLGYLIALAVLLGFALLQRVDPAGAGGDRLYAADRTESALGAGSQPVFLS